MLNNPPTGVPLKRRGFTLIELVVVIALLAILSALLVMGIGKMQTNGKRQQTRLIMQNLSAMFADYDVNRRVPMGMGNFAAFNSLPAKGTPSQLYLKTNLFTACPQNVNLDYNLAAEQGTMPSSPQPSADRYGLNASGSGSLANTSPNQAVPITRSFIAQLMTTPNNSVSVGKLPSSALMTFAGYDPLTVNPAPVAWNMTTYYPVGAYVEDSNKPPNIFIRTQLNLDPSGNLQYDSAVDAPPNYFFWMPAARVSNPTVLPLTSTSAGTPLPTPVILDAWGNPIIIVLGGVLGAPSTATSGLMTAGGQVGIQVNSPDYHPFFASAGPDGDFSKGDDNLYSFEK
jgi:prepilin-type N-terminal cleavage/methylation domain-containing protein